MIAKKSVNPEKKEKFCDNLQNVLDLITPEAVVIVMGYLNASVASTVIPGIKKRFQENQINDYGELIVNSLNNLKINNTFYNHADAYKSTC